MSPCWVEVTIKSPYADANGKKEWKNLAVFETIREGSDGVTEIWKDGRCARVQEAPAQIVARIQEASK